MLQKTTKTKDSFQVPLGSQAEAEGRLGYATTSALSVNLAHDTTANRRVYLLVRGHCLAVFETAPRVYPVKARTLR